MIDGHITGRIRLRLPPLRSGKTQTDPVLVLMVEEALFPWQKFFQFFRIDFVTVPAT